MLSSLLVLDLGGTFVFALSGAVVAVKHRLDIFGVLVLSFAAGNAGGITRDLLIGAVPPAAIADWKYVAVVHRRSGSRSFGILLQNDFAMTFSGSMP